MTLRLAGRLSGIRRTLIRRIFDEAPPGAINLGLGQPDLPTPPAPSLAGIAGIVEGRTGYTVTAGDSELRQTLAAHYEPFASGPGHVLVTVGSQEALYLACLGLLEPDAELLYPDPGYPAYPVVASLVGATATAYPLRAERGFRLDPDDVAARLSEKTGAVILCSPSNPTGACAAADDLRALTGLLEERGIPWISDEIYSGFVYDDAFVSPAETGHGKGLVVSSLSKDASMTGWRVGWVVGPPAVIRGLTAAHQYLVTCAPSVSQQAALAAFSPAGLAERGRYLERFRGRRAAMGEELRRIDGIRFRFPDGAFYFFVDVSRFGDSLVLARRILERRQVITIPGEAFGELGAGFLRISFAASEQEIREGVRRIGTELARS